MEAGMKWLSRAQDVTSDGGVSVRYSLFGGWDSSYPETTGYIIPTFLRYSDITGDTSFKESAMKMAEWELSIQQDDGSFVGGAFEQPVGKLVFDTGQIIFGLINAYKLSCDERFLTAAKKAGDWLINNQDNDGAWRKFSFQSIPHTYHSRVAWSLIELSLAADVLKYSEGAKRHLNWVLTNQNSNGWFENAGFTVENNKTPYTHTIAYTLRGLLEAGLLLNEQEYVDAVHKSIDKILPIMDKRGYFYGGYDRHWVENKKYSCLTGNAQFSIICSKLFMISQKTHYAKAANLLNNFLKTRQNLTTKNLNIRGAISGSSPIWIDYERFSFPNWATKFFIDALWAEAESLNRSCKDADIKKLLSFKYSG